MPDLKGCFTKLWETVGSAISDRPAIGNGEADYPWARAVALQAAKL